MTREEESARIAAVLAGDTEAFSPLVEEHQDRVYRLALRLLGNEADAADAAQDAFIKAFTSLHSFRGDSRFGVWLYRLTNNICSGYLRRRKRQDAVSLQTENEEGEELELALPDERYTPEALLEKAEDVRAVREAIAALPEDCRQILLMREIGGLSYDELAKELRLEVGTVKSRLNRARKKLCVLLAENGNFSGAAPSKERKGGAER